MVSQGGELQWSTGDKWNTIIEIPAGAIVEYKYVLVGPDGLSALAWQQGNNNVLAVGHADDNIEVFDTWESGPGAAVIAAGEETTREGRMLSWANEVESLFASQVGARTLCQALCPVTCSLRSPKPALLCAISAVFGSADIHKFSRHGQESRYLF